MKTNLGILILIVMLPFFGLSQKIITADQASKHVGEKATVCGKVMGVKYSSSSKGSPTFINIDKPYPNQLLTIIIWGSDRKTFSDTPENLYSGKNICITGTITQYKGDPQITVKNQDQIKIK